MSLVENLEQLAQNAFNENEPNAAFILTTLAASVKLGDTDLLANVARNFIATKTQEAILTQLAAGSDKKRITFDGFSTN